MIPKSFVIGVEITGVLMLSNLYVGEIQKVVEETKERGGLVKRRVTG